MCRKSRYLTKTDRDIIEKMYSRGASKRAIALFLEVNPSTVTREIRRGLYDRLDGETWISYQAYSSDIAQVHSDYMNTGKGRPLKIGNNHKLVEEIETMILSGVSPDVTLSRISKNGERPISTPTLYRYIDCGEIFTRITNDNLLEKSRRKRTYKKVRKAARPPAGKSIEHRPAHVDAREEFGHWEMDTVVGPQGKSKKVMLVLTERKTRKEIVYLMPDRKAQTVVKTLNMIERKCGERLFRDVFKTITVDNGVEFSDAEGLEKSRRNKKKRTKVYYCHPYSSCERGSNENANRLIRRHIPKGVNFDKKSKTEIKEIETWINNYPRKIFEYDTAENQFINEMEKLTG